MLNLRGYMFGVGLMLMIPLSPALAIPKPEESGVITDVPTIREVAQPATSIQDWLTHPASNHSQPSSGQPVGSQPPLSAQAPTAVRITAIKLNSTADGLDIIFTTNGGKVAAPKFTRTGRTLRAEITNAVLALPTGQTFQAEQPAGGIAAVRVNQLGATTLQVEIMGATDLPTAQIKLADCPATTVCEQGLTLNIALAEEELVVTAGKRRNNPQDIPISLTVLGTQQIQDAGVTSLRNVAALTPNFFTSGGDRSFNFQTIRGLGNSNYLSRDALSVYLDDVPFENIHQFLPGELFDLDRVEVLRGPQGTLYGRNSQAGVVNIISRAPTNAPEVQFGAGYGNVRQRQLSFSWSDAIVPNQLSFRLATSYSAKDGFTRNTLLDQNANPQEALFGRAQLRWTPTRELTLSFNAFGGRNRDGDNTFVPIDQVNPFVSASNIPGSLDVGINTQSLRIAYEGKALNLVAITARNQTNLNYSQDTDYSPQDLLRGTAFIPSTIWSQEIRIQSPNSADRFRWLAGGYFQSRSLDLRLKTEYTPLTVALGFPEGISRTDALFEQRSYAIFGQVEIKPISRLTVTAGLRYERYNEQLDLSNAFTDPVAGITPTSLNLRNSEVRGDVWLPRLGLQYQATPALMMYGTIARGYKPGTQNFAAASLASLKVDPENMWSYEVGLKSTWFNKRLTANLSAFWSNVDNYQVLLTDNSGLSNFIANGAVRTYGLELELNAQLREGLTLMAGLGYTNARFTDYTNPFSGQSFNGNRLTYAPDYTFNLGLQYRHRRGFFARVDLQGMGTYYFDDANQLRQDPFMLLNARIGYEHKNFGFYLYSNNLGDTRYVTTAFTGLFADLASYGDRRTFGFQVRAKF
jgi:iron complex outermembrane recepter protein